MIGDNCIYKRQSHIIDSSPVLQRRYHLINQALANLSSDDMTDSLQIRPPCRFEKYEVKRVDTSSKAKCVDVILDIAHNEGAIVSLMEKLKYSYLLSEQDSIQFK